VGEPPRSGFLRCDRAGTGEGGGGREGVPWWCWGIGGEPSEEEVAVPTHQGPTLSWSSSSWGGGGAAGARDPGRIHVPAAPRGSTRRPSPLTLHARRPGLAARPGRRGEGFGSPPALVADAAATPHCRLGLPAPPPPPPRGARPGPPPPGAPIRRGTAPHVTARHCCPPTPRPKFWEGRARASQPVGSRDPPRFPGQRGSRDLPTSAAGKQRVKLGTRAPKARSRGSRPPGKQSGWKL
jgi:hypothetical protein